MDDSNKILDYLFEKKSFIFGSYIYKYVIRRESYNDIDVAIPIDKFDEVVNELETKFECQTLDKYAYQGHRYVKYAHMNCSGTKFDLQDENSIKSFLTRDNIEITRIILLDHYKFAYLDHDEKIISDSRKTRKIIDDIVHSRINNKNFIKEKHRQYFKDWSIK
ncbi:putative nucleotidyltransferase [Cotonvirus japonicus]|uniref:Nucleotidyltransferase n=1 Tax=Cotonvirus japonicus TaxID=2811091 RepID=A0ABM7NTV0_9VIRU|nr:putative nucleotidyltransferase [Cotonvirus japonicus]BCS83600.1 putative nucleotidyltransferase [Cotonvirus japonicus]